MKRIYTLQVRIKRNPRDVRFKDLCELCDFYFGTPRQDKSSHKVYKTPWQGDPRINIQNFRGKAKVYQVRQVIQAIEKLESGNDNQK
jgi:hypothetical protein